MHHHNILYKEKKPVTCLLELLHKYSDHNMIRVLTLTSFTDRTRMA